MATTAFAPGSVTPLFVPRDDAASLGVSFATTGGVTATVESADATTVVLDGERASVEPVEGVLRRLGARATVRLDTDLPIGCGFGLSGAATLATALALNAEEEIGYNRDALVEMAHRAEVEAGTGLGDVFIQDRGGLVWDRGEGVRRAARTDRVEYVSFGGIATADVLGDAAAMDRVRTVGRRALAQFDPDDGLAALLRTAWTFAAKTGLATNRVKRVVSHVQDAGGAATMAMIGNTVVATGVRGALDHSTRITDTGAALQ